MKIKKQDPVNVFLNFEQKVSLLILPMCGILNKKPIRNLIVKANQARIPGYSISGMNVKHFAYRAGYVSGARRFGVCRVDARHWGVGSSHDNNFCKKEKGFVGKYV